MIAHSDKSIKQNWLITDGRFYGLPAPHPTPAQRIEDRAENLAAAAEVTESYISQLLTGKKAPPAPERTDIYGRMEKFLRLPAGKLAHLADLQRKELLKRKLADPPSP